MANLFRTGLLLAALTALFMVVGYWVAGEQGMIVALLVAAAANFFTYWTADRIVLRLYGAREVTEAEAPDLVRLVRNLALRAGLPMPRVYVIDGEQPNAFATGRSSAHAAIALTYSLLRTLPEEEIAGVLAHELAHVKNRDTLTMTVTATLAGAISMLANLLFFLPLGGSREDRERPLNGIAGLLLLLLAPVAATLVQLAISRTREYAADQTGAEIVGQPLWLARALARIEHAAQQIPNGIAERHPATAPLFIASPLSAGRLGSLFSTHPPMEERIARLEAMARPAGRFAARRRWF